MKYSQELIKNKTSKNGKIQRKTIRIKSINNNPITFNELRTFYNRLIESGEESKKMSISGMTSDKYITMKTFNADLKMFDEMFLYIDFYLK